MRATLDHISNMLGQIATSLELLVHLKAEENPEAYKAAMEKYRKARPGRG